MPEQFAIAEARKHVLWEHFETWAESEDVDTSPLAISDDWWDWWECFVSGAIAQMKRQDEK